MNETNLIAIINAYADDYSAEEVLEEFFGAASIGEIISDMWNAGLIPADIMDKFLNDE